MVMMKESKCMSSPWVMFCMLDLAWHRISVKVTHPITNLIDYGK